MLTFETVDEMLDYLEGLDGFGLVVTDTELLKVTVTSGFPDDEDPATDALLNHEVMDEVKYGGRVL